ncbi:fungal class II heme-containing peroxidase [Castilleja foliolosa]|uniref:Fungal class II heme-containing peroxidase n=1 Tax=Castilleja foliolosa TaxID=1961234 RepID=A0ABD3D2Z9_9LAMI
MLLLLFFILHSASSLNMVFAGAGENPFTPKGFLVRYWKKQISNNLPPPQFLLDKASPLTAPQLAFFSKLAGNSNSLSDHLLDFCTKANLLCVPDLSRRRERQRHRHNVNFTSYVNKNFTNYGSGRIGSFDSFKNYSDGYNIVSDNFRRYSHESTGHSENFTSYAESANMANQSFAGYGTTSTGGKGQFRNYNTDINIPNLRFTKYSDNSNGRKQSFMGYVAGANSGKEGFTGYGKNGNGAVNEFKIYGNNSNVISSNFKNYGETGNGGHDSFISYGNNTNVPVNTYTNYGTAGNGAVESFKIYRPDSNVGDDEFRSYVGKSNGAEVDFENYGQSDSGGGSKFIHYGQNSTGQTVDFNAYSINANFAGYARDGNTFSGYTNDSTVKLSVRGKMVNKWAVEPGKFFREEILKSGSIMPMPDISDKMAKRSFLPRAIIMKIPFSIFHAGENSSMAKMMFDTLGECGRAPSPGETKRCVASIEDMVDFATEVLGRDVVVRTTENTQGSNGNIMIGEVKRINGGNVTKSVSCHESLFPYLLYYCHSVPKVRLYEADILDPKSEARINRGVAICHLDTSSWSPGHGAFVALGFGPGSIEVCHWIFENDMSWTVAD